METYKRMPICRELSEQQRKWLDSNCCPACGLSRSEFKRRKDWTCCSTKCSEEYQKCFRIWQYWKEKAFERDKYSCVKCGEKPIKKDYDKDVPDTSRLIADHIIPIAIGGEEYELENVQTLCIKCNKIKTKEDMKTIALYRKRNKSQLNLGEQYSSQP